MYYVLKVLSVIPIARTKLVVTGEFLVVPFSPLVILGHVRLLMNFLQPEQRAFTNCVDGSNLKNL